MPYVDYDVLGERINRYQFRLVDCASSLHESVNGVTDPLAPKDALRLYGFLACRLNDWHPSIHEHGKYKEYDEAIREVCRAAMKEYDTKDMEDDLKSRGWVAWWSSQCQGNQ
jgi:hypothetical protein